MVLFGLKASDRKDVVFVRDSGVDGAMDRGAEELTPLQSNRFFQKIPAFFRGGTPKNFKNGKASGNCRYCDR